MKNVVLVAIITTLIFWLFLRAMTNTEAAPFATPGFFASITVNPENGALFALTSDGDVWVNRNTDNRAAWRKCGKVQPGRDWNDPNGSAPSEQTSYGALLDLERERFADWYYTPRFHDIVPGFQLYDHTILIPPDSVETAGRWF